MKNPYRDRLQKLINNPEKVFSKISSKEKKFLKWLERNMEYSACLPADYDKASDLITVKGDGKTVIGVPERDFNEDQAKDLFIAVAGRMDEENAHKSYLDTLGSEAYQLTKLMKESVTDSTHRSNASKYNKVPTY